METLEESLQKFRELLSESISQPLKITRLLEEILLDYRGVEKLGREGFFLLRDLSPTFVQRTVKIEGKRGELRHYLMPLRNREGELLTNLTGAYQKEITARNWREALFFETTKPTLIEEEKARNYVDFLIIQYDLVLERDLGKVEIQESVIDARDLGRRDRWRTYIRMEREENVIEGTLENGSGVCGRINGQVCEFPAELEDVKKARYKAENPVAITYKGSRKNVEELWKYSAELWLSTALKKNLRSLDLGEKRYAIWKGEEILPVEKLGMLISEYFGISGGIEGLPRANWKEVREAFLKVAENGRAPHEVLKKAVSLKMDIEMAYG